MRVRDVMSPEVETIASDTTVQKAARVMAEVDNAVLLVADDDRLQGILTERDILIRVVAEGASPATTKVADVMSSNVFTCRPEDDVATVAQAMRERRVEQIPVVDETGKLVGVITTLMLSRAGAASVEPERSRRAASEADTQ